MKFLGIDIGTGGSRACLIDERGSVVAASTIEHEPFASPQIGWAEQSPEDWWRAVCLAVRQVLSNENVTADEISAVSFSGQMHGSVLLDEADKMLRPALLWCDQRTKKQRWNENAEIKAILDEIGTTNNANGLSDPETLLSQTFDRKALASKGLQYEKLDQLTMDILFGVD